MRKHWVFFCMQQDTKQFGSKNFFYKNNIHVIFVVETNMDVKATFLQKPQKYLHTKINL